ncbi:hypothetical protein ROZALSC1DRAFT_27342, partial [Rozella allomycis CSF55]|uniref:Pre-mRNA-splicing factor SPF27 domain-containing protein n=1 Tax=Rozella allomycis (strain CSF55) TaxID=988480 RepID=A0A075AXI1_ROZAC|eukprot:EPZ34854.1 Pre-mRNA-splicing factor SPF27 domain-containing protein [Rozella allomycis CSF55]
MTEILDSLPYFDQEYEIPEIKSEVDRLIEKELANSTFAPPEPVENLRFKDDSVLNSEFERMDKGVEMSQLDMARYRLNVPKSKNKKEWIKAIENAYIQLEHQRIRATNLELLKAYGADAWNIYNQQMRELENYINRDLEFVKNNIIDINRQRKIEQIKAGNAIEGLELRTKEALDQLMQVQLAVELAKKQLSNKQ